MDAEKERRFSALFQVAEMDPHECYPSCVQNIEIGIDLGMGEGVCRVFGSDLTKEYVEINVDYRT